MLTIYNTLTRQKEQFKPMNAGKVGMYVCGTTIYDYCHVGHGRTYVSFDIMVRYMRSVGLEVNYVRNITDVDDKIINRANKNGESCDALVARLTEAMHQDFDALNMLRPDIEPTVTTHIEEIILFVSNSVSKHSYESTLSDSTLTEYLNSYARRGEVRSS